MDGNRCAEEPMTQSNVWFFVTLYSNPKITKGFTGKDTRGLSLEAIRFSEKCEKRLWPVYSLEFVLSLVTKQLPRGRNFCFLLVSPLPSFLCPRFPLPRQKTHPLTANYGLPILVILWVNVLQWQASICRRLQLTKFPSMIPAVVGTR